MAKSILSLLDKTIVKFSDADKPTNKTTAILTNAEIEYLDKIKTAYDCSYSDIIRALIIEAMNQKLE